jgi:DHA3 family tetracycline resistance protein-like MFS transporter
VHAVTVTTGGYNDEREGRDSRRRAQRDAGAAGPNLALVPLRAISPARLYVGTQGAQALLRAVAYTTYGLYAVKAASLGPLELVLVGAMLELSVVLAEVPTGIVADLYGRRLSVLVGFCVIGVGFGLMGSASTFWCIALGSVLWSVGGTFISGAHQAWLADEIGESEAAPAYLRGAQMRQLASLAGIPFGVALAARQLQLPMLVGAALVLLPSFPLYGRALGRLQSTMR